MTPIPVGKDLIRGKGEAMSSMQRKSRG